MSFCCAAIIVACVIDPRVHSHYTARRLNRLQVDYMYQKQARQQALGLITVQIIITLFMAVVWFIINDIYAALSAIYGGLIAIIPTTVLAWRMYAGGPGKSAREFISGFYQGGALKFLLAGVMFAFAAWKLSDFFLQIVTTFMVTQAAYVWIALRSNNNR